eukprot:CAMPEP_0206538042 /NCGR_PEP_ID=MMETSP0325_2-20121206/7642_1 /ASSEMBLY_ACC=CAM_ASM_000347 /TAXON_ID=2866 /ORGANISM="Crypthecodinium cohnii, Strain Seligo" /LENGTH=141 /DNA_ID=CAMNT_0054035435 /DNA_START=143 /DNA_END=568 /DNA_ORIENTATION=+
MTNLFEGKVCERPRHRHREVYLPVKTGSASISRLPPPLEVTLCSREKSGREDPSFEDIRNSDGPSLDITDDGSATLREESTDKSKIVDSNDNNDNNNNNNANEEVVAGIYLGLPAALGQNIPESTHKPLLIEGTGVGDETP